MFTNAETIFTRARLATTWFYAIYLMASTRCGISAKQIQRETGVTYKTAWRMFKQIRTMLDEDKDPLGGKRGSRVEIDETYMGGKRKNRHGVIGVATDNRLRLSASLSARAAFAPTPRKTLRRTPSTESSKSTFFRETTIFTDDYAVYDDLGRHLKGYRHRRIRHSEKVYVIGDTHTNTIEGFWSLIKRCIGGVYDNVGKHYLQSYLNEFSFRYNHRFERAADVHHVYAPDRKARCGRLASSRPSECPG